MKLITSVLKSDEMPKSIYSNLVTKSKRRHIQIYHQKMKFLGYDDILIHDIHLLGDDMNTSMWMVRAGEAGYLFQDFKEHKIVAIGWNKVGDLTKLSSHFEIKERTKKAYSEEKEGSIAMSASQISKFRLDFQKGDFVITYNTQERKYLVGEIIGEYEYNKELIDYPNIRQVKWLGEMVV